MSSRRPRVAVFASGGGRSFENLVEHSAEGRLAAEVALLLSDRDGIGALERAERLGVPHRVLTWREFDGPNAFSRAAFDEVREARCNVVVLAGFLRLLRVPAEFQRRVLNIHPALLPAFGGKGYYGDRVHAAVLEAGVETTGCTVHYVDDEYDHGEPILQREVPVEPGDTVETLAARVFEAERIALPEALNRVLERLAQTPTR